jgi:archaellum component FlaF (FlaF/FlaG flagellin family)
MFVQQTQKWNVKHLHMAHNWPLYMKDQNITADLQPNLVCEVSVANYTGDAIFASVKVNVTNQATGSSVPAIFASLQSGSIFGFFSENVFFLLPGESKVVAFTAKTHAQDTLVADLQSILDDNGVKTYNQNLQYAT